MKQEQLSVENFQFRQAYEKARQEAFYGAILALIFTHPDKELFKQVFTYITDQHLKKENAETMMQDELPQYAGKVLEGFKSVCDTIVQAATPTK